ncbi:hypothetical protein NQ317_011822 [Molorchus minor]|uniref:LysM domain-containing protein n=1 Tax=Molorchus minor TaxID=1323400 RepID=A0ABQ9JFY3_9CUCU|nr:hypothetical protein NQ317_011822 [Molorchus minor]
MFLSYLSGSPGCLQNISCQQPHQSKKYVAAGDTLLKLAKVFSVETDMNYEYIIQEMDRAANVGLAGGSCQMFDCSSNSQTT